MEKNIFDGAEDIRVILANKYNDAQLRVFVQNRIAKRNNPKNEWRDVMDENKMLDTGKDKQDSL